MTHVSYTTLHEKLDALLDELGVPEVDVSGLNPESAASLHAKVDALCAAHGGMAAPEHPDSVASVKDKLNAISRQHTDGDS